MSSVVDLGSAELNRFTPEARRIIALARVLGWSVRWTNQRKRVVVLRTTGKEIQVPSTNINANRARAWTDQIISHTPLADLRRLVDGGLDMRKDPEAAGVVALIGTELVTVVARRVQEQDNAAAALEQAAAPKPAPPKKKEKAVAAAVTDTVSEQPTLVSTKPWMVRRSGIEGGPGKMYESPVVTEESYSDGSVLYRCKKCRYSNDNPRSVSSHNSRTHGPVDGPPAVLLEVKNYETSGLHREQSGARRLAADITAALDSVQNWGEFSTVELATVLAERIIEARPERAPAEPLTPEQIIDRVTALVDHGRLAEMHREVTQMREALAAKTAEADTAKSEAERWHDNVRALREILSDVDAG